MQKKLAIITLTFLFTMILCGAASAANGDTNLQVDAVSGEDGETVTLSATLTGDPPGSSTYVPLDDQEIYFWVGSEYAGHDDTNSAGQANEPYTIDGNPGSTQTITAYYPGGWIRINGEWQYYDPIIKTNTLTVKKIVTTLTVNSPSGYNGDNVPITATLTRNRDGASLSNRPVSITVNGQTYNGNTNSNGQVTWNFPVNNMNAGPYNIQASYAGSSHYAATNGAGTLTVNRIPTAITVNSPSGYNGDTACITARLVRQGTSTGIVNKPVTITVNGQTYTANTDANGYVTWNFPICNMDAGDYNIQADFVQDGQYAASCGAGTLTVKIIPTTLTADPASGYKGDQTTLKAQLWDTIHDKGIGGMNIDFWVNHAYVGSGTTDNDGFATFTYTITQNVGTYLIEAIFGTDNKYDAACGTNTLTVDPIPTSLKVDDATGNKGKTVNLKATLTDTAHGNVGVEGKKVLFKVNGVDAGTATTDANGVATLPYLIELVGGTYDITAEFAADDKYAFATGTGKLKVPQSSIYVLTTVSKKNPTVGETIKITFKLGNKGPDAADNVVFTYKIPEGLEFVSLETEPGYPAAVYDPATRTVTWTLGTVPVLDPWLNINVKVLKAGSFAIDPTVTTDTYDTALPASVQFATVNAVEVVKAASNTVGMQKTGIPIAVLVLAILAVLGGFVGSKRK